MQLARSGSRSRRIVIEDAAAAGDRYAYSLDGGALRPIRRAAFSPTVCTAGRNRRSCRVRVDDAAWNGPDPCARVIYELHVGTFTREGTFAAAPRRSPYLADLGITAIELMPVADFAGARNWGYDGVALFAPSRAYGRPDDLRALVNAAHAPASP